MRFRINLLADKLIPGIVQGRRVSINLARVGLQLYITEEAKPCLPGNERIMLIGNSLLLKELPNKIIEPALNPFSSLLKISQVQLPAEYHPTLLNPNLKPVEYQGQLVAGRYPALQLPD